MRRPSLWTVILGALTLAVVLLAHFDPWRPTSEAGRFTSVRSSAQRLFPAMMERGPESAVIELLPNGGAPMRMVPEPGGHALLVDDERAGPVDPEALEGLWASLRMAVALRSVPDDVSPGPAIAGRIRIALPDEQVELVVRGPTPDGAGVYASLVRGEDEELWVVEREMAMLLEQTPLAWLARRLVVVEPGHVVSVRFGDGTVVERGDDGSWRSVRNGQRALLSERGVDVRLERLVSARLDPVLPDLDRPLESEQRFVTLTDVDGRTWSIDVGEPCPGASGRVRVRRGPGWTGCVLSSVLEPWPLPGGDGEDPGSLLEPRLVPYAYGRVVAIEQRQPGRRSLRRSGGDWILETEDGQREVGGAEVLRWYQELHDAEVHRPPEDEVPMTLDWDRSDVDVVFDTDANVQLRIRCIDSAGERWCRRDEGVVLRARTDALLAFDPETFADRTLVRFDAGDARAVEILPAQGSSTVRQSAHFDLGVWRLDAPEHPEGDEALSELALEQLLAVAGNLRAQQWVPMPTEPPLREIRLELTPQRGRETERTIRLHPGCVGVVDGRAARLSEGDCEALSSTLLHTDPIEAWIRSARALEVTTDGDTVRLVPQGEAWVRDDGGPVGTSLDRLAAWASERVEGLGRGDPPSEPVGSLRVLPRSGPPFVVEMGEHWARIVGSNWYYRFRAEPPSTP